MCVMTSLFEPRLHLLFRVHLYEKPHVCGIDLSFRAYAALMFRTPLYEQPHVCGIDLYF